MPQPVDAKWAPFLARFRGGEWRTLIFRDLVLADAGRLSVRPNGLTVLDVGCGGGFDGEEGIQREIARIAARYIGVDPATDIGISDIFGEVYQSSLEEAPVTPGSVDLAFAVMVLEHLDAPEHFWNKVLEVLRPGGVFWGFTVDARHWFVAASLLAERLKLKEFYLNRLHGKRGEERYSNYPVFYRSNTPEQLRTLTSRFANLTVLSFQREGQMDYYLPGPLRRASRIFDRFSIKRGWPGSILAVRVEK